MKEPIRHHYIPQFILRKFCNKNKIKYYDIRSKEISYKEENFETKIAKESRVQFHNPIGVFRRKMGNKKMEYQYCLFDLDGTLTDSAAGITNSVMYALEKYDIHVEDRSELYMFIGPPLDYSFRTFYGFSDERTAEAVKYYREYYGVKGLFENEVYDGIREMLSRLKEKNVTMALATSKPYEFAVKILKHFGIYDYFDFFGAATMDGSISKKKDVIAKLLEDMGAEDKASILMVGDRYHDIEGAKANGLKSAGVLWGYGSEEELKKAGAEYIFSKPSDVQELF